MSISFWNAAATFAASLFALTSLTADVSARGVVAGLVIHVYDLAKLGDKVRAGSIATASDILQDASIPAEWRDCTGLRRAAGQRNATVDSGARPPCDVTVGDRHALVVRIVGGDEPQPLRAAGNASQPELPPCGALGYSIIDGQSGDGRMATVFVGCVAQMAHRAGGDHAVLLGRVVAHEIGHLLLGTNSHSDRGLMRAQWTDSEIYDNRREDWLFSWGDRVELGVAGTPITAVATR